MRCLQFHGGIGDGDTLTARCDARLISIGADR